MIFTRFQFILKNILNKEWIHILKVKVNSEWQPPTEADYKVYVLECQDPSKGPISLQTFKCTLKCVLEKAGIFDETRGFDEERLIKTMVVKKGFKENIAREIIGRCDLKKGDSANVCDWVEHGIACIGKEEKTVEKSS